MTKKTGLGKGLDALIPAGDFIPEASPALAAGNEVLNIPIDQISPNPRQPRSQIKAETLLELTASIRENGILQPLIVTRGAQPDRYVLVAGERRWLAARQAGLELIPAILREASETERLQWALIENIQRADLAPLEEAEAFRQLADDFGLTQEEIAIKVGKSRAAITNTLRLLRLPDSVKEALAEGKISEGHARALLALPSPNSMVQVLKTVLLKNLSVRQTEELVKRLSGERPPRLPRPESSPEYAELENRLRDHLGTKVNLNPHAKGGTLVIRYYSDEELNALVERILGE
jgi:ParB family chromosome partitioning protein